MSVQPTFLNEKLYDYLLAVSVREPEACRELRLEAAERDPEHHCMQIGPDTGQFLAFLLKLIAAKRCLEIGTYMGYSSLWLALHLPSDGKLITCDINQDWYKLARRYWQDAGVSDKIEFQAGPALESLDRLSQREKQEGCFDFIFIDADKVYYKHYYERCLKLLHSGGLLAFDNMLWSGRVACSNFDDNSTQSLRSLNAELGRDKRIDFNLLAIGDGLGLVRKK